MKRTALFVLLGGLLVAGAFAQSDAPLRVATAEVVNQSLVNEVPLTGSVSSPRVAQLSAEVAGLIGEVKVDAGDRVEAGDLLIGLDRELADIELERARAGLNSADEALAESERLYREAQTLARNNNIADSEVSAREARLKMARAARREALAEVHLRELAWRHHRIVAPFSGTVTAKLAEQGEWVTPGRALLELADVSNLRLDFQVPQRYFPQIDETTRLQLRFNAFPERNFTADIHRKVPKSDNTARTFLLRAHLQTDSGPGLIPGMSVDGVLQLASQQQGLTVPRDALLRYPDGRVSVWRVREASGETGRARVEEVLVKTGLAFGDRVEVRSGLAAGERIVTRGNESLQPDQQVRLTDSNQ